MEILCDIIVVEIEETDSTHSRSMKQSSIDCDMTSNSSLDLKIWPTATVLPGPAKRALLVNNNASTEVENKVEPNDVKETRAVIIDIGTSSSKIGFAGEPKPSFVVSSTVGKPLRETFQTGDNWKEHFIGNEKVTYSSISQKLVNPLRYGIIVEWDSIEAILEYLFVKEMKIPSEEHAVLMSDPPLSPSTNRAKYAEMMFETFNVPAFQIANQSSLSMYSYGKTSGLVVECGHGMSYAVPIIEGNVKPTLTCSADYAGSDITKYLMQILNGRGYTFNEEHLDIIENLKHKYGYVPFDFNEEICLPQNKYQPVHIFPDGLQITIKKERFICPEALFQPSLIDSTQPSLQSMAMTCINNCDASFKETMVNNILLGGGTTMLPGFFERFQKELNKLSGHQKSCISAWPDRQFCVWRGGSILASLHSFQPLWLHRREYDEHGPSIVYRKCF
ncbi:actin-like protein 7A [Phyllobates terribilis]|uniref:actin-like protein 7A n=1 Tax=Phyllobates terribilis TaxID=111132 RepID=UPI003CCAD001